MKEQEIQILIGQCIAFFQESNYSQNRISVYKRLWKYGIVPFMEAKGLTKYEPGIGEAFIDTCHYNGAIRHQEREKIRSIRVLNDMLQTGLIRKCCFTPVYHRLDGELGQDMEKLIQHLTNLRRSKTTIGDYRLYQSEFLHHLKMEGVHHKEEIAEKHIISFVLAHPTNKVNIVSALRVLFRYWNEEQLLERDFRLFFESFRIRHPERVPSFFTKDEIQRIENSIPRSSAIGKRNYAMTLLASRLGLRASDIANLMFSQIDWDNNLITITMQKTQKMIQLPLLTEVGNAIVDYLRNGRPQSNLAQVFLSCRAPFIGVTRACVCAAINTIIVTSGVDVHLKHHGPHSLRHSLASAMLCKETTFPVISESLGHRHTDTTMVYLKIDIASLMKCALPVPSVTEEFYLQRGGAFYE